VAGKKLLVAKLKADGGLSTQGASTHLCKHFFQFNSSQLNITQYLSW